MKKIKKQLLLIFIIIMAFLATFFASQKMFDPIFTQQTKNVYVNSLKSKTITKYEAYKSQLPNVKPELVSLNKTNVSGGFMKEIDGIMYVGTQNDGLMKFDKNTNKMTLVDKTNVSGGFIAGVDGVVYVGTNDKGLMMLDKKAKKLVSVDKTNVSGGFMREIGGIVYVGTNDKGLMRLNKNTKKLEAFNNTNVWSGFIEEIGGIVYVGTYDKGLMRFRKNTKILVPVDKTNVSGGFIKEIGGVVYVGTSEKGLMRLDKNTKRFVLVDKTNVGAGFIEEVGEVVYVGAGSYIGKHEGLKRLDEKTKNFVAVDGVNVAQGFMEKIDGVVYVGTSQKGLMKLDFTDIQNANDKFLKQTFKGVKIQNQGLISVADIAKKINDLDSLKKYTGIEIPKLNRYSTLKSISATSDIKKGIVNLKIVLNVGAGEQILNMPLQGKSESGINEIIANNDQKSSKEIINNLLDKSNASIVNQGTRKVSNIASTIKDITTLKNATGINLNNQMLINSTISSISAVGNTNGVLTISIKIFTKNATQQELTFTKVIQGKSNTEVDTEIADNNQNSSKKNIEDLLKNSKAFIVNQGTTKVSNIASNINDAETLKNATGIDLSNLKLINSTISSISAIGNTNGVLTISIKVITKNATQQELTFTKAFQGKTDTEVDTEIADNNQNSSKKNIEDLLKKSKASIVNQGTRKVSDIASTIKDIATLKNATGIDLSNLKLINSTISSISAVGNTNGVLTISIKIFTKNATQEELTFTKAFQGKTDTEVDTEIATEIANKKAKEEREKAEKIANEKQVQNIAKFKEKFNNHDKILNQGTKTVGDIAEEIKTNNDIDFKISVINKWFEAKLKRNIDGTEITNIYVVADSRGNLTITIETYTKNATQQELTFTKVFKGKSDKEIDKEIADKKAKDDAKKAEADKEAKAKIDAKKNQGINISEIKKQFVNHFKLLHQNTKTVDMIAGEINFFSNIDYRISAINELLGTKLIKRINGTEITDIYVVADPLTGKITITITTYTKYAPTPEQTFEINVSGMNNSQVIDLNTKNFNIENNKQNGITKELIIIIGAIAGGLLVLGGIIFFTAKIIKKREK